jgi:hypothetical protein
MWSSTSDAEVYISIEYGDVVFLVFSELCGIKTYTQCRGTSMNAMDCLVLTLLSLKVTSLVRCIIPFYYCGCPIWNKILKRAKINKNTYNTEQFYTL